MTLVPRLRKRRELTALTRLQRCQLLLDALRFGAERLELPNLVADFRNALAARPIEVIVINEHTAQIRGALLAQEQLEHLLAAGHIAHADLLGERGSLGTEAAAGSLLLGAEGLLAGSLGTQIRLDLGELAAAGRYFELELPEGPGFIVAFRDLTRDPALQSFDLLVHGCRRGLVVSAPGRPRSAPRS